MGDLETKDLLVDLETNFLGSLTTQNNSGLPDNQEEKENDAF